VVTDNWHKRILKASYFINIAKTITDVSAGSVHCMPSRGWCMFCDLQCAYTGKLDTVFGYRLSAGGTHADCGAPWHAAAAAAAGPQALEADGCDYSVEVFIEAPVNQEGEAELQLLRSSIPNAVLLVASDMLWTWQMMASADILVMSNSMFSLSAALMNPNALTIHVPYSHYSQRVGMFKMKHWLVPLDENGTLPDAAADAIQQRTGATLGSAQQQQI
jgi:hypothetical protein